MKRVSVIVAGSRWELDKNYVWRSLDWFDANMHIIFLAEGGQRLKKKDEAGNVIRDENGDPVIIGGVDYWAQQWARERHRETRSWPADWKQFGSSAGPIRNAQMAREARADVALIFPGGNGTANMRQEALRREIKVVDIPLKSDGLEMSL